MNSGKVEQLKTNISEINFSDEEYAAETHRMIYNDVASIAHVAVSDQPSDVPPTLVFYAIRNIIHPTFIVGQIPDLFNLLTMVDISRQFANKKIEDVLVWHDFYSQNPDNQDVRLLTEKEVRRLEHYQAQSEGLRSEYFLLLRNLCLVYIHYLWTAPESCLLPIRLNDFFPGSLNGFDKPSSFLFHMDLDEDEKQVFVQLKDQCSNWMNMVIEWESEREELGRQQGRSMDELKMNFEEDFQETFPPPVDYVDLLAVLKKYIKSVEDMVKKLEEWFQPSNALPMT